MHGDNSLDFKAFATPCFQTIYSVRRAIFDQTGDPSTTIFTRLMSTLTSPDLGAGRERLQRTAAIMPPRSSNLPTYIECMSMCCVGAVTQTCCNVAIWQGHWRQPSLDRTSARGAVRQHTYPCAKLMQIRYYHNGPRLCMKTDCCVMLLQLSAHL